MAELQESMTGMDYNHEQDQMPTIWLKNTLKETIWRSWHIKDGHGPHWLLHPRQWCSNFNFLSYRILSSNWNKSRTLIKTEVRDLESFTQSYWLWRYFFRQLRWDIAWKSLTWEIHPLLTEWLLVTTITGHQVWKYLLKYLYWTTWIRVWSYNM